MIWTPTLKTFPNLRRLRRDALPVAVLLVALALAPVPASANGIGTIFVANERSNNVSVIEHATNSVLANIQVGNGPRSISFTRDGRFTLVANRTAGSLSIIDRDQYRSE